MQRHRSLGVATLAALMAADRQGLGGRPSMVTLERALNGVASKHGGDHRRTAGRCGESLPWCVRSGKAEMMVPAHDGRRWPYALPLHARSNPGHDRAHADLGAWKRSVVIAL